MNAPGAINAKLCLVSGFYKECDYMYRWADIYQKQACSRVYMHINKTAMQKEKAIT